MNNKNLHEAKRAKNDEFYTLLADIEKEMQYYDFQGKVVYCNCDDYRKSNFVKFFKDNFVKLGLKKLISTAYNEEGGIAQIYKDGWAETIHLFGDGSYNSDECIEYLKQADIVVTNPPFSLFRDYFSTLMKYNKKFIIMGSMNAITYKEIFPYIKEKKLWFGQKKISGGCDFQVPDDFEFSSEKLKKIIDGKLCININAISWFTNIKYDKQIDELVLTQKYNEKLYQKYDNYDAINVDKVKDIPIDYDKYMGVPISVLKYLNTDGELEFSEEKFELLGNEYDLNIEKGRGYIDGKRKYSRVFIKKKFEILGFFNNYNPNAIVNDAQIYGDAVPIESSKTLFRGPVVNGKAKYARIIIKSK